MSKKVTVAKNVEMLLQTLIYWLISFLDIPHPDLGAEDLKGVAMTEYAKQLFMHY